MHELAFCVAFDTSGLDSSYPSLVKERRPERLQASRASISLTLATSVCPSFLEEKRCDATRRGGGDNIRT